MFAISKEKEHQKLQTVTVKIRGDEKKSHARIVILCTPVTAFAQVIPTQTEKEGDSISEILLTIFLVAKHYPELSKAKMAYIYKNYCHLKSCRDKGKDKNITFENS